jgi:chemotaxis protein methyltransferase CheR
MVRIYANQGNLSEALEWCDKGMEKDKLNPTFHFLRATILQEKDQINEASVSLKRTLYLDPDFVLAQFALGNLTRQQRRLGEADKHFENALSLLSGLDREAVLPESEGITAGRLREMIRSITGK